MPCEFGNTIKINALANSGATINLMPYSFYKKHDFPQLKSTNIVILMVCRWITYPCGVIKNLLIKEQKFIFLVNFTVLDMKEEDNLPIILGRHFLSTINALVDFHNS